MSIPLRNMFPINTNGNNIYLVLSLADCNLISYPNQSSLISYHFAILFDLNFPIIQINLSNLTLYRFGKSPLLIN